MKTLESRIPPPLVAVVVAALMWAASSLPPAVAAPQAIRIVLAIGLAAIGAAFAVAGVLAFRRARTTLNPLKPESASALVSAGVYRLTRNPMYVGMLFGLFAWAALLWSPWALLASFLFVGYIGRFQIAPEERALAVLFGDDFAAYRRSVRRWL